MIKVNVQVPSAAEYWEANATAEDGQAAAEKLVEMLREELPTWWRPGEAEINVEIADPAHGQFADEVQVVTDYGRAPITEQDIKAYIENNWRTALDSVA